MADDSVQTTPTADATVQQPAAPATSGQPAAQPAIQAAPQAPATGAVPDGFVPSHVFKQRLDEARGAAVRQAQQEWAQREAQIRAEADRYKQQLQALVGVTPPQNPEIDAVRQQFGQLYPGLSKLEEAADRLLALQERAGDLETQNQHYWEVYARSTTDRLFEKAQEVIGVPLTEEGKQALHSSFVGFVQSSPELEARYSKDPTLVDDFIRTFTSSFIDPVRRSSTATVQGRAGAVANLPQDTPGGVPSATPAPKYNSLDERVAAGWALHQHNKNT